MVLYETHGKNNSPKEAQIPAQAALGKSKKKGPERRERRQPRAPSLVALGQPARAKQLLAQGVSPGSGT